MATKESKASTLPNIVTVTTLGSLGQVRGVHGPIRPDMYSVKSKDQKEEGTPMGEFRGSVFMGTKKVLSPMWDNILQEWQWGADYATFTRLVKAMNLRYPKDHPNGNGRIKVESLESHKRNRIDPVFQNEAVVAKFFLEDGRGVLRMDNPFHEFLYHCFRKSRKFMDETVSGRTSKHSSAQFKMTATNKENTAKRNDVDKRLKVMGLLSKIANDEGRMRAIASLTKLPGYSALSDVNGIVVLLDEQINNAPDRLISTQGNRKFIDVLVEKMELEDAALKYEHDIMRAYSKGIIRAGQGGINLQGTFLAGPSNFDQAVKFFKDPSNQEYFFELTTALGK